MRLQRCRSSFETPTVAIDFSAVIPGSPKAIPESTTGRDGSASA
jgi:hypothetical protein